MRLITFLVLVVAACVAKEPRFVGYEVLGDVTFVRLEATGQPSRWVKVGEPYGDYVTERLDRAADVLHLRTRDGEKREAKLTVARIREGRSDANRVRFPAPSASASGRPAVKAVEVYSVYPPGDAPRSEEGLDWAWIESKANPMRQLPLQPSIREQERLAQRSEAEKEELVELYRQSGWHVTITHDSAGVGISYRKITPPGRPEPPNGD